MQITSKSGKNVDDFYKVSKTGLSLCKRPHMTLGTRQQCPRRYCLLLQSPYPMISVSHLPLTLFIFALNVPLQIIGECFRPVWQCTHTVQHIHTERHRYSQYLFEPTNRWLLGKHVKTSQSNQMYFMHILFHKHQQMGKARAPSQPTAKLIKFLRTKVWEFTWESRDFVCLTKAKGEKGTSDEKKRREMKRK